MNIFKKKYTSTVVVVIAVALYYMVFMPWISPKLPGGKPAPSPSASPIGSQDPSTIDQASPSMAPSGDPGTSVSPTSVPSVTPTPIEIKKTPVVKEEDIKFSSLKTDLVNCEYSSLGGGMTTCFLPFPTEELKEKGFSKYGSPKDHDTPMRILAELKKGHTSFRLFINNSSDPRNMTEIQEDPNNYTISEDAANNRVTLTGMWGDYQIQKIFTIVPDSYEVNLEVKITNTSGTEKELCYLLSGAAGVVPDGLEKKRNTLSLDIASTNIEEGYHIITRQTPRDYDEKATSFKYQGPDEDCTLDWIATSSHFFTAIVNPADGVPVEGTFGRLLTPDKELIKDLQTFEADMVNLEVGVVLKPVKFAAGETVSHTYNLLLAPKSGDVFQNYEKQEYAKIVDFGFFAFIAQLILGLLNLIYMLIPNYGVAIILLTIIIQMLMHPLTRKQYVSMHKMQKVQPLIAEAQKRFKKDKQKLGEVTMAIYQKTGASPFGTCLPMLIQLPIFFALYSAFYNCIELRESSFLWIGDLSGQERIPLGSMWNLVFTRIDTINVLPILMTAVWFIQQSLTPKSTDPNQQTTQKMMKFMPIVFFFIFYSFPSGLVLYWLTRNLTYIFETLYVKANIKKQEEAGEFDFSKKVKLDTILKELNARAKKAR